MCRTWPQLHKTAIQKLKLKFFLTWRFYSYFVSQNLKLKCKIFHETGSRFTKLFLYNRSYVQNIRARTVDETAFAYYYLLLFCIFARPRIFLDTVKILTMTLYFSWVSQYKLLSNTIYTTPILLTCQELCFWRKKYGRKGGLCIFTWWWLFSGRQADSTHHICNYNWASSRENLSSGFLPGMTQTGLLSYRDYLETRNFGYRN